MNIETTNINHSEKKQKTNLQTNKNSSVKFADELQKVAETEEIVINNNQETELEPDNKIIDEKNEIKKDQIKNNNENSLKEKEQLEVGVEEIKPTNELKNQKGQKILKDKNVLKELDEIKDIKTEQNVCLKETSEENSNDQLFLSEKVDEILGLNKANKGNKKELNPNNKEVLDIPEENTLDLFTENVQKDKDNKGNEILKNDVVKDTLLVKKDSNIRKENVIPKENIIKEDIVVEDNTIEKDSVILGENAELKDNAAKKESFVIQDKFIQKENVKKEEYPKFEKDKTSEIKKEENVKVDDAIEDLNVIVKKFTQSDEKKVKPLKSETNVVDKVDTKEKGENLINNDLNITENKEIMPQMTPNMNFGGDGKPFSSFVDDDEKSKSKVNQLASSAEELAEEAAILSTMAENIAIANKNNVANRDKKADKDIKKPVQVKRNIFDQNSQPPQDMVEEQIKTVTRNNVVKKVDVKTNITIENVVKLDSVVVNEADAEFFAELVQKGEVDLKNLAPEAAKKSIQVSKSLADMLAKSMENNQPLRIDFDNNISVIIRISRDGKISADFLPSSQVAEAYLRENLPILRQKFDDGNIKYDELNQRERREQREHSRKKGRDNE